MSNIEYQAHVYDGETTQWHYEVSITDGLMALVYKENGRKSAENDLITFPANIAEDMAKAILRVVELSKENQQ